MMPHEGFNNKLFNSVHIKEGCFRETDIYEMYVETSLVTKFLEGRKKNIIYTVTFGFLA